MTTPDGISDDDWKRVHELSVELFNALESDQEVLCRARLLEYLNDLERKYGVLPSIVATRADFIDDNAAKEALLKRAYSLATDRGDSTNALYVAHSLAEYYIEDSKNANQGRQWLDTLRGHLLVVKDADFTGEYERLSKLVTLLSSPSPE